MPKSSQIDKQVLEQAGEYYLDLQDGTMSADELKAWQGWIAESDEHRLAFARMEVLWGTLELADKEDWRAFADQARAELTAENAQSAAAAHPAGGSVISMVSAASGQERTAKPSRLSWLGAAAAAVALFFVAATLMPGHESPVAGPAVMAYKTVEGQQRAIKLADGSIVELGSASSVSVAYTDATRALTLTEGEAVFTVAKNPNRPFVVRAGQGSVTAIGTVFNVRKSADNVQVRVLEGTVAVRPVVEDEGKGRRNGSSAAVVQPVALVTAGRQTEYSHTGLLAPVLEANVHEGLSWRVGVLTMVDWSIADVIQELNRYLADEITIGDKAVGDMRFTGTVYPDQVDAWLEGLQQGYPIEVVRLGGSTILMFDDGGRNS